MTIASRTPEGRPNRCSFCGKLTYVEPSPATWDAPCPHCGWLMWYEQEEACVPLPPRLSAFDRWIKEFRDLKAAGRLRFSLPHLLVECVRELSTAQAVAVWRADADEEWRLLSHSGFPGAAFLEADHWRQHADLLTAVSHCPEPIRVAPRDPNRRGNASESTLWLRRICREDHVLVLELFLPEKLSFGEYQFLVSLGQILHDIVAVPIGAAPRFEPGIEMIPLSSVDPPVKMSAASRHPRTSWWSRILNAIRPRREKSHA